MRSGFSLVEIAIVLVILGLMIGGVMAGQSLVRAAELRTIHAETQEMAVAIHSFRRKYSGLPGDITNATNFWGQAPDCAAASGDARTCNGNGNGTIGLAGGGEDPELFRAWQQLASAGLVGGDFSGIAGSGSSAHARVGTNVPKAKVGGVGYTLRSMPATSANPDHYQHDAALSLLFGRETANGVTLGPALTPQEAWNVDVKMDDSRPSSGGVRSLKGAGMLAPGCSNATSDSQGEYNLSNPERACPLILRTSRR